MSDTLILLFHPDPRRSRANAALASAAAELAGVEIVDMATTYPEGIDLTQDGEREAARLLSADRIVLQFPLQWYSTPPLLKAWQDAVLTRMFYVAYDVEGSRLEGTPIMLAVTAGNKAEAYRPGGRNMFAMMEVLTPLRATANRCGLPFAEPHVLYEADKLPADALKAAGAAYAAALARWIDDTSPAQRKRA
jgi:glutathione-regulated potassium-efflux system ancillary protein KefG